MAGFIRRYGYFPGIETITLIEGVIIVDLPPPGAVNGVSTGVVAMTGEFPDMTYGTAVDGTGAVTTKARPVEVTSAQDMLDKVGGFDETLGNVGNNGGNGFISLRNKKYSRLVLVPVNLASAGAGRLWRDLPTNLSATQATPVVPLQGGVVSAGREFRSSTNRVRLGKRSTFTALGHFKNGVDGAVTSAGAAATQTFNSAGGGFLTAYNGGVIKKGMLLVVGVISASGAQGANAATYRVTADAVSATALVVEKLDGSNFDWTTGTALAYRIHPETDGDTGGTGGVNSKLSDTSGYTIPCRPIDATIAAATSCAPTLVPAAGTATSWDPLSGLTLRSHQSNGFVYDANVQAPNAANHASIDALYLTAIDGLLGDQAPQRDANIVFSSRASSAIRSKLKSHVLTAASQGVGRSAVVSPSLQTVSLATVIGDSDPGVGANRDERVWFSWPGEQTFVPEAVGFSFTTAEALTTTDGLIDVAADGRLAALLSNLPPERNPGQAAAPVPEIMSTVAALQRGLPTLGMAEYMQLRAAGICGLRFDRTSGFIFQSGVTSSLISGMKNINRRRMADFIEDSVAQRLVQFTKLPLTPSLKDTITGEIDAFLNGLLSLNNPAAQRISGYTIDDVSGNTPDLESRGVYVVIAKVRTLATADFIVLQAEVGEGVNVTSSSQ